MRKIKIKNLLVLTLIAGLLAGFTSCKTKRHLFRYSNVKPMRAIRIYEQVQNNEFKFKSLSIKFSADYEKDGSSQSFGGTIRIQHDSLVWVSIVPALGIEAARILMTKDSVKFINRINSTYYSGNYNFIKNLLNLELDFEITQSILTDDMFLYSRKMKEAEDAIRGFRSRVDSNMYVIQSLKERKVNRKVRKNKTDDLILEEITILPEIFKIAKVFINDYEFQKSMNLSYSNFTKYDEQMMPQILDFKIKNKNSTINVSVEYTKITLNKDLEYPFSIPEKYKKVVE